MTRPGGIAGEKETGTVSELEEEGYERTKISLLDDRLFSSLGKSKSVASEADVCIYSRLFI